ncbi:MAG: hypothetical protein E7442_05525 [Ruminococcaceae bacterium]|nr:hypothetical protein [Oscillospiraceae bacterium]
MLLAVFFLVGCGATAESAPAATEAPVVTPIPAAAPEHDDDYWLEEARNAMEAGDYHTALTALDEVVGKTDAAGALRGRIHFLQGETALNAGEFVEAAESFQRAEEVANSEELLELAEAMLRGDYMEAARIAAETNPSRFRPWRDFLRAHMKEPQTLEEVFQQAMVFHILDRVDEQPLNETGIESLDRAETDIHNVRYIGPIVPYNQQEKLMVLSGDAAELEVCGQGGGKALIVRRQPDYPRGAVYATVDKWMSLLPAGLYPASLDEVDYILYLDYDYSVCAVVAGNDGGMLEALQMSCVVRLVNEHTGEELYRSEKIMGAADYDNQYRLDFLAEDGWLACGNPPIGRALAEAIAALPG